MLWTLLPGDRFPSAAYIHSLPADSAYLYNLNNPCELKIGDIRKIQKNCMEFMKTGYDNWLQNKDKILVWIEQEGNANRLKIQLGMLRRFFFHPIKVVRTWLKYR